MTWARRSRIASLLYQNSFAWHSIIGAAAQTCQVPGRIGKLGSGHWALSMLEVMFKGTLAMYKRMSLKMADINHPVRHPLSLTTTSTNIHHALLRLPHSPSCYQLASTALLLLIPPAATYMDRAMGAGAAMVATAETLMDLAMADLAATVAMAGAPMAQATVVTVQQVASCNRSSFKYRNSSYPSI
ncbi:hypothetical protein FRB95_014010 [Tulasnella sp. JGI-2019a]|nr:hypothetical protein FRB95_014010 [Tulasnella sp. JGI-2019a]